MRKKHVWLWLVLALGLVLRAFHYLRNPVVWHDEAALLLNAVEKTFWEHLGPLFYAEAAPPLFLWVEKIISLTLGESTFAMRLLPFLASCLAVGFIALAARSLFGHWPAVIVTLFVGFSDRLLWHSCEAKPYAVDVFVNAFVIAYFAWCRQHTITNSHSRFVKECLFYAILSPFLLFLSFPSCFVLGGVALTLFPKVLQLRGRTTLAYLVFLIALGGFFLLLLFGPIKAQRCPFLVDHWSQFFPDWSNPMMVLPMLLIRLTEAARYNCEPIGNLLVLFMVFGAIQLWRTERRAILGVLLWPVGLLTCAWLIGKYPIGPSRVAAFLAPSLLMLAGLGVHGGFVWIRQLLHASKEDQNKPCCRLSSLGAYSLAGIISMVLVIPVGYTTWRLVQPWPREDTTEALAFLQEQRRVGETVVGSAWQHTWYLRDLESAYHPLISEPFSPQSLRPLDGRHSFLGQRSWLLMRDTFKHQEIVAFRRLQEDSRFRVHKLWTGELLTVYRVERIAKHVAQARPTPVSEKAVSHPQ